MKFNIKDIPCCYYAKDDNKRRVINTPVKWVNMLAADHLLQIWSGELNDKSYTHPDIPACDLCLKEAYDFINSNSLVSKFLQLDNAMLFHSTACLDILAQYDRLNKK